MLEKRERYRSGQADLSSQIRPTTLNVIGAAAQSAYFGVGTYFADKAAQEVEQAKGVGTPISKPDFDHIYRQYGDMKWTPGMTQEAAAKISLYKDEQREYDNVLAQASTGQRAAAFVPSFAIAMLEPKNLGIELGVSAGVGLAGFAATKANPITAAYLPVKALARTYRVLQGAKVSARTKFAYGAGLGVVSAAVAEPSNRSSAQTLQEDYDYTNTLMNIATSAMLGGTIEAAPTWVRSLRQKYKGKAFDVHAAKMDTAAAQMAEGQPIDLNYPEAAARIAMADATSTVSDKITVLHNYIAEKTGIDILPSEPDLLKSPDVFSKESLLSTTTLYHGTNVEFQNFDLSKSGNMVFFGEDEFVAANYATGAGGNRAKLKNSEKYIVTAGGGSGGDGVVYELQNNQWKPIGIKGDELLITKKSLLPLDKEYPSFSTEQISQEVNNEYAYTAPKNAKIITKNFKNLNLIDISTPQGRDVISELNAKTAIGGTLVRAAKFDKLDNGTTQLNTNFWSITKNSAAFGDQILKDIVLPLKKMGYDGIRFKDDQHKSIALFDTGLAKEKTQTQIETNINWAEFAQDKRWSPDVRKELTNPSEYVVRDRKTGETIFKTNDKTLLDQVNPAKYETVPLVEHFANLNGTTFNLTSKDSLNQAGKIRKLHERTVFSDAISADEVLRKIVAENEQIIKSADVLPETKDGFQKLQSSKQELESIDDIYAQERQFRENHANIMRMIESGAIDSYTASNYLRELGELDPDAIDNGFLEFSNCLLGM